MELLIVVAILLLLMSILLPVLGRMREPVRRANCAANLKQIGLALLQYASDYNRFFPNLNPPSHNGVINRNLEPLNTLGLLYNGKAYGCPSARVLMTTASYSAYSYQGSGLKDDNTSSTSIAISWDLKDNHPNNEWLNALFIDGHVDGRKPVDFNQGTVNEWIFGEPADSHAWN